MKNEMREDLLITREDILMHMSARNAEPDGEEKIVAAPPCGLPDVFFRLIRWLTKEDD